MTAPQQKIESSQKGLLPSGRPTEALTASSGSVKAESNELPPSDDAPRADGDPCDDAFI